MKHVIGKCTETWNAVECGKKYVLTPLGKKNVRGAGAAPTGGRGSGTEE